MTMNYQFRPIDSWPGPLRAKRKTSPFRSSYRDTINLLGTEVGYLRATRVIIQIAITEGEIRNDGLPRADCQPSHPGVIVSMETPNGPLRFPCDAFPRWTDNLRAIALALEALRRVNRYGVTRRGEQYTGWKALPPAAAEPQLDPAAAATVLARLAQLTPVQASLFLTSVDQYRAGYRMAAMLTHPDRGGNQAEFIQLQKVKAVLDRHHHL
jgi:hypothetical protein